ncbi:inositol monophosphatase family protein [Halegenticoccus soli]|uniref:inositol monophosphatase family protein n=1 Tax=Halegenticoccus soli TaxID=1985678 RepID=UPI000C6E9735|nr:inositol monophosphatase family protein [Halegenticoccus soli]
MPTREAVVMEAARAGADYAMQRFRTNLTVERKTGKTDLVTEADRTTQRRVVSTIEEHFPADAIVGEEEDERKTVPDEGYAWIVDPIDGTQNFVRGLHGWVTSVAVVRDGKPISAVNVAPALGETYRATSTGVTREERPISVSGRTDPETFLVAPTLRWARDDSAAVGSLTRAIVDRFGELRRLGSAQLTLSLVASGALDAAVAFDPRPNPWDTVAGAYLVARAGGTVTDLRGDEWRPGGPGIVASNGEAHEAVLSAVKAATE